MTKADEKRIASHNFKNLSMNKIPNNFNAGNLQQMEKDEIINIIAQVHPDSPVGAGVYRGLTMLDKTCLIACVLGM